MIGLPHYLLLAGILFSIAVAGIFLNRKNVILLLMCIELMLLAVNFNFVAFSRFLGILDGQVFVFFILTVAAGASNTAEIGAVLYTQYAYPFQLAAVVLLIAIVAAITLTLRRRPGHKVQDIGAQVAVKAEDRVRLVSMPVEREP